MNNSENVSYNDSQRRQAELRRIIWPNKYGLAGEATVAVIALVLFNINDLGDQFLNQGNSVAVLSTELSPLQVVLNKLDQFTATEHILLFALWGLVGALIYILLFRVLQVIFGVSGSLETGWGLVRRESSAGLMRWLASLHDFFLKVIVVVVGTASILGGTLVCFSIASQELRNGLLGTFPSNIGAFVLSLVGALLSVRLIILGLSLVSVRFRNWYAAG